MPIDVLKEILFFIKMLASPFGELIEYWNNSLS